MLIIIFPIIKAINGAEDLGPVWIKRGREGERRGVELAENRLILGQFYSLSLPLNPNRPLSISQFTKSLVAQWHCLLFFKKRTGFNYHLPIVITIKL